MITNNSERNKIFSRRLFILIWVKIICVFILLSRLFYLQILKHKKYITKADSNRIKSFLLPPLRGKIIDKNGVILATNSSYYRILFNKSKNLDIEKILTDLSNILNISKDKFIYYKTLRKSSRGAILIYDDLNFEQIAIVEANSPNLPGIYIEPAQRRYYPFSNITSNLLGYVATVNELEKKQSSNSLLSHPDFKIGKIGLEKIYEHKLRGKAGISYIEVDAHGFVKRAKLEDLSQNMVQGENLNISIDLKLQEYIVSLTKDKRASVTLMNIKTGEIAAMTSTPSFEPNQFLSKINQKSWQNLINNPAKPLINKAVSAQYPPGSTFKIIVALAALENGFDANKKFNCTGKVRLGKRWFHCWKKEGHGVINLNQAIEQSCNCYFYKVGHEIGINKISKIAFDLGLGKKTSNNIYNEKKGNIPTKEWKKQRFNRSWVVGDTYNSAIGQGYVEVTNLQLAVMMSRVISGKKITPKIIKTDNNHQNIEKLNYKSEHIDIISKGLFNVVNNKKGTAYYSRLRNKKYQICGKTGTAQIISINHDSDEENTEFDKQNHGLFVGYAPFHQPKYAISVIVEHGKSGSGSAAPIASKVFKFIAKYENDLKDKKV